jgi:hypothetical protein
MRDSIIQLSEGFSASLSEAKGEILSVSLRGSDIVIACNYCRKLCQYCKAYNDIANCLKTVRYRFLGSCFIRLLNCP